MVSFQNGLTVDAITAVTGPGRLVASFVNFGADVLGPGQIMQGNIGTFRVGEPEGGAITPRVEELARALPYAEPTGNIMGFLWGKEAYGAMLFAGAVSPLSIAETLEDPRWRPLMLAIAREVLAQAPVAPEGFDGFEPDDLEGSWTGWRRSTAAAPSRTAGSTATWWSASAKPRWTGSWAGCAAR